MTTTTKPRAVSPTIHEATIERHFARNPATREPIHDAVIGAMADAVRSAREAAEKARRVADAIMDNDLLTVSARHTKINDECWRVMEGALRQLDASRQRASRELRDVEARTSAPPRPADAPAAMLATEIRSRLASMSPAERKKAINAAINNGDDVVVGAVLNGPAMLSGLSGPTEAELLRMRWRAARHPADVDRVERIGRAVEDLDRAGAAATAHLGGLSSAKIVDAAAAAERAVEAAIRS